MPPYGVRRDNTQLARRTCLNGACAKMCGWGQAATLPPECCSFQPIKETCPFWPLRLRLAREKLKNTGYQVSEWPKSILSYSVLLVVQIIDGALNLLCPFRVTFAHKAIYIVQIPRRMGSASCFLLARIETKFGVYMRTRELFADSLEVAMLPHEPRLDLVNGYQDPRWQVTSLQYGFSQSGHPLQLANRFRKQVTQTEY